MASVTAESTAAAVVDHVLNDAALAVELSKEEETRYAEFMYSVHKQQVCLGKNAEVSNDILIKTFSMA
jgi:hypothetical protein